MRGALALPGRRKRVLVEALVGTAVAWGVVHLLPYRTWRAWLGSPSAAETDEMPLSDDQGRAVADVLWAFRAVERLVGTRFTCLMYALSCSSMLASRRVPCLVVLGARLPVIAGSGGLHAWVCVGSGSPIVGGDVRAYTIIARFRRA